jgi:hypothetical protein
MMDWSLIITIGGYLLGIGVVYGTLKQKISALEKYQEANDKRMDTFEDRHNIAIDGIREEIRSINGTLNQLVGKIDLFFSMYCKDGKNE